MVDPTLPSGLPRIQENAQPSQSGTSQVSGQGAAFKALLEQLDGQARQIHATSEGVERPDQLAGAVDQARSSLEGALSLGNQLLEAFRASQLGAGGDSNAASDGQG